MSTRTVRFALFLVLAAFGAALLAAQQPAEGAPDYETEARQLNAEIDQAEAAWDEQYRLSNGRSGSVAGSWSGDRLELNRVDRESGRDAVLEATLDRDEQTLEGTWQRFELADGRPAAGRWRAVRIGAEDDLPDLGSS